MACSSALFVHHRRVWLQVMEMAFDHLLDRAERPIHLSFDIGACGGSGHSSMDFESRRSPTEELNTQPSKATFAVSSKPHPPG